MALTATEIRAFWGQYGFEFMKPENRENVDMVSQRGIENWKSGQCVTYKMGDKLSDSHEIKTAFLHKGVNDSPAGGRAIDHTGPVGDSSLIDLSFTQITRTFSVNFSAVSNYFQFKEQLDNQIKGALISMNEEARNLAITELLALITQVNNATAAVGTFNGTSNFFEIAEANAATFFQYAKMMMQENKHMGMKDIILDSRLAIAWEELINQGGSNDFNSAFQFNDMTPMYTNGGLADIYTGEALIMPEKSFCIAEHLPPQYLAAEGTNIADNVGMFGVLPNPSVSGSQIGMHMYKSLVDTSAGGGDVEDIKTEVQLVMYRGTAAAPLSTADESPIFAVGQMPTLV